MPAVAIRAVLPMLLAMALPTGACAQQDPRNFPSAATAFLGHELPAMETAVAQRDRDYFEDAMGRMLAFSEDWGFKSHRNPALAPYAMCTEAVSDFLVVGMCRIMTTSEACEPGLAEKFDANLRKCQEAR